MITKKELRIKAMDLRDRLSSEQRNKWSGDICSKAMALLSGVEHVMLYNAIGSEVDLSRLVGQLWDAGVTTIYPVMDGRRLKAVPFGKDTEFTAGRYGILEPVGMGIEPEIIDVFLVPGLAFSAAGDRLGYGAGYYDNLLAASAALKVGVCFTAQMFEAIPMDDHDQKMDIIINEADTLHILPYTHE